jgi:hypothetical protein
MARFLIEVDHEAEARACARTVKVFLSSGSHYLTHADWGCGDGVHAAWLIVDVDTRDQALAILPPADRARARIVSLNKFSMAQVDQMLAEHPGGATRSDETH